MSFKTWFVEHYFKDRNEDIRNITLKLFYIAFFTFIIVAVFFFSLIALLSKFVNVNNICELTPLFPVEISIKWFHFVLFSLAFIGFLYWIDYGYYLVNKYRKFKGI